MRTSEQGRVPAGLAGVCEDWLLGRQIRLASSQGAADLPLGRSSRVQCPELQKALCSGESVYSQSRGDGIRQIPGLEGQLNGVPVSKLELEMAQLWFRG